MRPPRPILLMLCASLALLPACEGPAGLDGADGVAGADGADGTNGTNGSNGSDGTDGTDGTDGLPPQAGISLARVGTYASGVFDESAAEIVDWDGDEARIFVVNANDGTVDVLDGSDPTSPTLIDSLTVAANGGSAVLAEANSVSVQDGVMAVAVAADPATDPGVVQFYDTGTLAFIGQVEVCALPDMLTFTPDGLSVVVACEGEPNDDYTIDPEGAVAIVDVSSGFESATATIADFNAFDGDAESLRASGVRIFGPGASVSQDLEPEYVAVSDDSSTAWVTLQENNALAIVDLDGGTVLDVLPLGFKDHSIPGNELDASDRDDKVNIRSWPVLGMYQPDSITSFTVNGTPWLITANEGDARDYDGFSEEVRVEDLVLDPDAFPDAQFLQNSSQLGRLSTTNTLGDTDGDGDFDLIYAYGARSFSIWNGFTGGLVYDSGSDFEVLTARRFGLDFNNNNDEAEGDTRSDAKGPEPEAVAVGRVGSAWYAFIGLERMGGIMVYDVSNPESPRFVQYVLDRSLDPSVDPESAEAGDLGPEGFRFVPADDTPTGTPWLIVGSEVSGTTSIYEITILRD